jgi:hypothetical protein
MDLKTLISIALFTLVATFTVLSWSEYLRSKRVKEGFVSSSDAMSDQIIAMMTKQNEPVPTDQDAMEAHQTLLRYIRNDYGKGIKIVRDFGSRFFGDVPIRADLDVRTLMDDYRNPLNRL